MTGRGCQGVAQPFKVEHAGALLVAASSSKQPARSASLFLTYSPAGALLRRELRAQIRIDANK